VKQRELVGRRQDKAVSKAQLKAMQQVKQNREAYQGIGLSAMTKGNNDL
jgi:hypothetical protein